MIKKGLIISLVLILAFFLTGFQAQAQAQPGSIGIGLQSSYAFWGSGGLSVIYDLSPAASIQGIFGIGARRQSFEGRYLHRFRQEAFWDGYTFGSAGIYSGPSTGFLLGGGIGIEYDIRGIDGTLPPISLNADIGVIARDGLADFNVQLRTGFHYRF